jgi:hypothetical protein
MAMPQFYNLMIIAPFGIVQTSLTLLSFFAIMMPCLNPKHLKLFNANFISQLVLPYNPQQWQWGSIEKKPVLVGKPRNEVQ